MPLPDASIMELAKRHTLAGAPTEAEILAAGTEPVKITDSTPVSSPIRSTFGSLPGTNPAANSNSTILLRRPSGNARLMVDRGLSDVFSESCAQARSKAQLHQALFLPDMPPSELRDRMSIRESTMLKRRKSFLDSKAPSFDIAFNGEVRGSVMPVRQTKSNHGRPRAARPRRGSVGAESATEVGYSADETATTSDFGSSHHRRAQSGHTSRPPTALSATQAHRFSMSDVDCSRPSSVDLIPNRSPAYQTLPSRARTFAQPSLNRRKTASSANLHQKASQHRTRSMPVSPAESPMLNETPPPLPPKPYSFSADRAAYSRGLSHFPLNTDVETAGLGLIQSTMEEDRPTFRQNVLRRSMSFLRTNRSDDVTSNSSVTSYFPTADQPPRPASLIANGSAHVFNYVNAGADGSGSGSGSGSSSSTDVLTTQHRAQSSSSFAGPSVSSKGGDEDDASSVTTGYSSVPTTPKRKKSMILHRLRGFTPM